MSRDLGICMTLAMKSEPFNAGQYVELKFVVPECGEIEGGGDVTLRINALDAPGWLVGDRCYMHLRGL